MRFLYFKQHGMVGRRDLQLQQPGVVRQHANFFIFGILILLLGAKCVRGLMHRANDAGMPIPPRATAARPGMPKPDDETFYAPPKKNLPNPPPRPPAPPHKPSPPHPVEHSHPT